MRERLRTAKRCHKAIGITPAYAGKTVQHTIKECTRWDHPRVCGKDSATCLSALNGTGSPPRMRERQKQPNTYYSTMGITPAYAGKTETAGLAKACGEDHPRVCGKDEWVIRMGNIHKGSPPRMRERRNLEIHKRVSAGITPAYAGKTHKYRT